MEHFHILAPVLGLALLLIGWAPPAIAYKRGHNNFVPILVVWGFLGWTVIGWFVSLVWSLSDNTD